MTIEEFTKKCPVEVGDYFYRKIRNQTIPDRLEAIEITETEDDYIIKARYIYHTIGPNLERLFSSKIFKDENWVIEKRNRNKVKECP